MNNTNLPQSVILIVDDLPDNVKLLLTLLTKQGFKVLIATHGESALKKAESARPDLILLDIMMPDINGFEVCQRLKSVETTREIPIIFMTALTDIVDKVKGFQVGAADYITKPFQYEEVLARINTHLSIGQLQQQLQAQNQQLQTRTEELEKRNQELDAFAHSVAHDLKNPLNTAINLSNWLVKDYSVNTPDDTKLIKKLKLLEQAGQQAVNIIDALLLLAGVSRQTEVVIEPLDMSMIVSNVIEQRLERLITEYQGTIGLPETWPVGQGYGPWIEEIWLNYLSNGLKYGGRPPILELGATIQDQGTVCYWVNDNGKGLTEEEQAKLFTPFTRLHFAKIEGHGLGLSIVQKIVEKLGGQIGVNSLPGRGSRFYFTLPKVS